MLFIKKTYEMKNIKVKGKKIKTQDKKYLYTQRQKHRLL